MLSLLLWRHLCLSWKAKSGLCHPYLAPWHIPLLLFLKLLSHFHWTCKHISALWDHCKMSAFLPRAFAGILWKKNFCFHVGQSIFLIYLIVNPIKSKCLCLLNKGLALQLQSQIYEVNMKCAYTILRIMTDQILPRSGWISPLQCHRCTTHNTRTKMRPIGSIVK